MDFEARDRASWMRLAAHRGECAQMQAWPYRAPRLFSFPSPSPSATVALRSSSRLPLPPPLHAARRSRKLPINAIPSRTGAFDASSHGEFNNVHKAVRVRSFPSRSLPPPPFSLSVSLSSAYRVSIMSTTLCLTLCATASAGSSAASASTASLTTRAMNAAPSAMPPAHTKEPTDSAPDPARIRPQFQQGFRREIERLSRLIGRFKMIELERFGRRLGGRLGGRLGETRREGVVRGREVRGREVRGRDMGGREWEGD